MNMVEVGIIYHNIVLTKREIMLRSTVPILLISGKNLYRQSSRKEVQLFKARQFDKD